MTSSKEDLIQKVLETFTGALQCTLPLEHFSQFYNESDLDKLAQAKAKEVMVEFQKDPDLNFEESCSLVPEIFQRFQRKIQEWKAKNEENKSKCDHFLQSQVDFLLADFTTSVAIQLVSAPDFGLQDLEMFLERRKILLIDIFEKLSKPGEPQSIVKMKTSLEEKIERVKIETLEQQRLHLQQKASDKAKKILEDAQVMVFKLAEELKSELEDYEGHSPGQNPKDLVKEKIEEINVCLRKKCKMLEEYHPNIYSALHQTTAEIRKCLDDKDYQDMSPEEFAETLHVQLQFDFTVAVANHVRGNASERDLESIRSNGEESASGVSGNTEEGQNEIFANENETQQHLQNDPEVQVDLADEEVMNENEGANEMDEEDTRGMDAGVSNNEAVLNLPGDGVNLEEEGKNDMEWSSNFQSDCERPNKSKKNVSKSRGNPHSSNSHRRSSRLVASSKPIVAVHSRQRRDCVVTETRKRTDDDDDEYSESSGEDYGDSSSDDDDNHGDKEEICHSTRKRLQANFSKPNGSKLRHAGKLRRLDKPNAEKITYLHLSKQGFPIYRCNICYRKCYEKTKQYHGEHCGKKKKPFVCDECGKGLFLKANFERHLRTHTGKKPFKCSKCSERFLDRVQLERHIRSHEKGARYNCKTCKLTFTPPIHLHDHIQSKHRGKLPFVCKYCDQRFATLCLLRNHVIIHADIRPFQCPDCTFSSIFMSSLARHIQRKHSPERTEAQKRAHEAAVTYLIHETNNQSYLRLDETKINSLVISHVIQKANLELPKRGSCARKSSTQGRNP